jgi:hypothetical protein
MEDNIDVLLNEIDENAMNVATSNSNSNGCIQCKKETKHKLRLECKCCICLECSNDCINNNNFKKCPNCNKILVTNINVCHENYVSKPMVNLDLNFGITTGSYVWAYAGGHGHNWLYSMDHIKQLEEADENDEWGADLDIAIQGTTTKYKVVFDDMVQFPDGFPNKSRNVIRFLFQSKKDLKQNKIIGVAGKLI